jgi:hypothetical protein
MFLALALMNIFHPAHVLQGPESEWRKADKKQKRHGNNFWRSLDANVEMS